MPAGTIPTVKICGLQSVEVLKSIIHLPIDHIGFVFAPSKRQVKPDKAGELISYLKNEADNGVSVPLSVGVFVNPSKGNSLKLWLLLHLMSFSCIARKLRNFANGCVNISKFRCLSLYPFPDRRIRFLQVQK